MCVCMCMYMCLCVCACTCVYMHVCICVVCVYLCVCLYMCMYVCVLQFHSLTLKYKFTSCAQLRTHRLVSKFRLHFFEDCFSSPFLDFCVERPHFTILLAHLYPYFSIFLSIHSVVTLPRMSQFGWSRSFVAVPTCHFPGSSQLCQDCWCW